MIIWYTVYERGTWLIFRKRVIVMARAPTGSQIHTAIYNACKNGSQSQGKTAMMMEDDMTFSQMEADINICVLLTRLFTNVFVKVVFASVCEEF
jgi:hypothetical protein